ncbi:tryptophan-rich sensory protein [Mucilaginibacter sp. UR6-1]|uniref:TspO/MBR family protein n=1 Tax=Mucilaginibacter sp. UR6-1 TaxID=1435643 RepID=UPI001E331AD4|nr:TspO/MBR family protein [Mucilaginibacter sp. UR6-1]MCC8408970.1 tryptophan-rich sensory protein [Mucilaginibacter sp. UR6-1]
MTTVTQHRRSTHIGALIISILITLAIGFTASYFTRPEIPGWYAGLQKPSFSPPNWLFAPVWTSLYIIIGIAAYLVWQKRDGSKAYTTTRNIYILQLILNFSWSVVFFGMHQMLWAFVIIVLLWLSIIGCIAGFSRFSKTASWLMAPYLLWVSFASALNFSVYLHNK